MTTLPRLLAGVLLAGLAAACSAGGGDAGLAAGPGAAHGGAHAGTPLTVEQLAAKAGCAPRIQVDAADVRTGYCETADGRFFVSTFTTEAGKDAWMDAAPEYTPHLVGPLWTVLGPREVLELLKDRLDGDLHLKDHRTNQMHTAGS
ncbi:hypothetical protein [Nonomuraea pusilla]|uniref:Lipoprotein n=1 Tax=Nonomuraea pusilla TaxID=46177 RepID=A0A1H7LC08_9ACTN|nr:hypothetical protein [Nonomuraea pusilla]SEK96484.1 hypothetical protein SAMN05660976_01531 [Nonomuraea pusilla]